MDYKEKYEQSLARAREFLSPEYKYQSIMASIFPELKESEDEQIRKEIIKLVKFYYGSSLVCKHTISKDKMVAWLEKQMDKPLFTYDDILALQCCMETSKKVQEDKELYEQIQSLHDRLHDAYWLEKQGEQKLYVNDNAKEMFIRALERVEEQNSKGYKLTDCDKNSWWEDFKTYISEQNLANSAKTCKAESIFVVGKWVVANESKNTFLVNRGAPHYQVEDTEGDIYSFYLLPNGEEEYHLWTIEDAKDGDVLYSLDSCQPFIYKERKPHEQATAYCGINKYGRFFVGNTKDCVIVLDDYVPATKEQRDQLEMVMFEAGYEWDTKKKELKKIEVGSENYKKKERTSESTIYEDDIHYSNDCADCTRDSCEDCYPY